MPNERHAVDWQKQLDDGFLRSPRLTVAAKLIGRMGRARAVAVWFEGLTHARRHHTAGQIAGRDLDIFIVDGKPRKVAAALVQVGIWRHNPTTDVYFISGATAPAAPAPPDAAPPPDDDAPEPDGLPLDDADDTPAHEDPGGAEGEDVGDLAPLDLDNLSAEDLEAIQALDDELKNAGGE